MVARHSLDFFPLIATNSARRFIRGDAMIVAKRLQQAYSRDPGVRITVVGGDSILVYAIPDVQEAVEKVLKR